MVTDNLAGLRARRLEHGLKQYWWTQVDDSGLVKGLELDDHEVRLPGLLHLGYYIKGFAGQAVQWSTCHCSLYDGF